MRKGMKTSFPSVVFRSGAIGLCILPLIAPQRAFAEVRTDARCPSDSKLLNGGPTQVFGNGPGTFWNLVEGGLQSAFGNDEAAKLQYISGVFGQQFATLDAARDFNLQAVSDTFDKNQDGLVCVFDLRGTRAYLRDRSATSPISRLPTTRSARSPVRAAIPESSRRLRPAACRTAIFRSAKARLHRRGTCDEAYRHGGRGCTHACGLHLRKPEAEEGAGCHCSPVGGLVRGILRKAEEDWANLRSRPIPD